MSQNLNEKQSRAVAALIQERIDEYLGRYPYARFPIEPLEEWKKVFSDPKTVPAETLRLAVSWHFRGWQRKSLSLAHRKTIASVLKAWPEFAEQAASDPASAFRFWEQNLPDWQHGFSAAALLLHLLRPEEFELVDVHRLQAMSELLKAIEHPDGERPTSHSLEDLERYTRFFWAVFQKLPYGTESRVRLDRFLKMYGNRHGYKRVSVDYLTKEAAIRDISWETASSKNFDLSQIKLRSNADKLFACLLQTLDEQPTTGEKLSIAQITECIPLGTAGICNPASYNYAMVALFGSQKDRDYFQFESAELQEAFTEQANHSTRDMKICAKHADEPLVINPKYRRRK